MMRISRGVVRTLAIRIGLGAFLGAALFACSSASSEDAVSTGSVLPPSASPINLHEFGSVRANKRVCPPARPGEMSCQARIVTDEAGNMLAAQNSAGAGGYGPANLESAYNIPTSLGTTATIAIVDPFDYPAAGSDLATYRANYGLPPVSSFRRVDQNGGTSYPSANAATQVEEALDLDMASAACPSCNLILVEANSSTVSDMYTAVDTAASLGATVISISWVTSSNSDQSHLNHPGVAIFAAAGDNGYGTAYPAASPLVTAVGGTTLLGSPATAASPRGWAESAWVGTGSGCTSEAKPSWQSDTQCTNRVMNDVSADADPVTGVAVYMASNSWFVAGGTSLATPLSAGIYALTGHGNATGAYSYGNAFAFYDVTSGSNGSCGGTYVCTAEPGYDGPTGNGTPNGRAMAGFPAITSISPSAGSNAGGTVVTINGARFSTTGGTQFTFDGALATNVSCASSTTCVATSPLEALIDISESVDVVATVAGDASETGVQDLFTYEFGPNCSALVTCAGIPFGFPDLVIQCPSSVSFYDFAGTPEQTLLATGASYTVRMDNVFNAIDACLSGMGCTAFSNYEASSTYCGTVPPPPPPPSTCNGARKPVSACTVGWRCCGTDGWRCGVCE